MVPRGGYPVPTPVQRLTSKLRPRLDKTNYSFKVSGRGEADPAVPNTSERSRKLNRRVSSRTRALAKPRHRLGGHRLTFLRTKPRKAAQNAPKPFIRGLVRNNAGPEAFWGHYFDVVR